MTKSKITLWGVSIMLLLCAACHRGESSDGTATFTIEGALANAANKTLYIEEMTPDNGAHFLDSIQCDAQGHFEYKGTMTYQTFFNIHTSPVDFVVLLPRNKEHIVLHGDASQLGSSYRVEGSPESQLMWEIQNHVNESNLVIADIAHRDQQYKATLSEKEYKEAHKKNDSAFIANRDMLYLTLSHFIEDNRGSLSTLYAIDAPYNHNMRVFYAESSLDVFEAALEGLTDSLPNNPHTQYFKTRVDRIRSAHMMAQQQQQPGQEITIR